MLRTSRGIPKGYKFSDKTLAYAYKRRTVNTMDVSDFITPQDLLTKLDKESWPYKEGKGKRKLHPETIERYKARDRALVCCAYLMALRISEVLRLRKKDFQKAVHFETREEFIQIREIKLSKSKVLGKPRRHQTRVGWLPLRGERAPLTKKITEYLNFLGDEELLFKFKPARAWQIITHITGYPPHFFRAFGEDYLYEAWGKDAAAVSGYVKVDIRTFAEYIHNRYGRGGPV